MYIKNAPELIDNGQTKAERVARASSLDAIEAALVSVEPGRLMRSKLRSGTVSLSSKTGRSTFPGSGGSW